MIFTFQRYFSWYISVNWKHNLAMEIIMTSSIQQYLNLQIYRIYFMFIFFLSFSEILNQDLVKWRMCKFVRKYILRNGNVKYNHDDSGLLASYGKINVPWSHDDVIKWRHFPRYWPFVRGIHRSPVNSLHKGQWRGALMFSLICAWINA